jgi:hypothetical protein
LHINFVGSGLVTSVTLQRSGISTQNTLTNVYLYDGTTRLTDGYSFNINGTLTINGLSIAVNGSHVITVRADVASATYITGTTDYASSIAVALTGFTGNSTTTSASVMGNSMQIVTGSAASVTLSANTVTPAANVNAGVTGYTFWSAPLQVNTRAVLLKTANFRMIGSAPVDALSNIKMFIDGVDTGKIATVITINGSNYASFDLTSAPITLTTGSHTIDVRADVQKGTNRTVTMSVQQASDLTITDPQVGVNIAVGGTVPNSAQQITILTGSVTVTVDPTFTSATNVSSGATNAVIGRFIFHAYGENVKVTTLNVTPLIISGAASGCTTGAGGAPATGTCGINNVTLYFNGSQIGSQVSQTSANQGSTIPFTLGSQMIAPAGQDSILEVRADLQTTASNPYTSGTVTVTLPAETTNGQGMSSQATLGAPTNAPTTTGLSISSATLSLSVNPAYANQSVSPNVQGTKVGSYTIQNGSTSESVRITSIKLGTYVSSSATPVTTGTTPDINDLSALRTSDITGSGSTPIQPTGLDTFSVNDTLAPGASMTLDILANTGSKSESGAEYIQTAIQVTSIGVTSNTTTHTPSSSTYTSGQILTLSTGSMSDPTLVVSSTTPSQYIASPLPNGAANASQASYNFVSTSGTATINELKFTVSGATTATKVCVGTACATPDSNGVADINSGLSLAVPNGGGGYTVNAQVSYPGVGTGGTAPNTTSLVTLSYVKYTAGGTPKASGTTAQCAAYTSPTCTTFTVTTGIPAKTVTLVGSSPTVTVSSTAATGLNMASAENKIGEVTVTANAAGSIKVRQLVFNIGVSGFNSAPTWVSPRLANGSTTIPGITCVQTTNSQVTCTADGSAYATDYLIGAGQPQVFSLYDNTGSATNTGSGKASVTTSLVGGSSFVWDDTSSNGTPNSTSGGVALNGTLIYNFPSNSYTISQ